MQAKQVEAITHLHARVVEVARKELFNGINMTLTVSLQGGTAENRPLSDEEMEYDASLSQWREESREEEDKARLWIDVHTVDMVATYVLLTSHCSNWDRFGQGDLTQDRHFLNYMRCIFGSKDTNKTTREVVINNSTTGQPECLNLIRLSHQCLSAIQQRIRLEMESPLQFRLQQWVDRLSGEAERRSRWRG